MELLNPLSIGRGLQLFPSQKLSANCLAGDSVGNAVYVTGAAVGDVYQVATVDPRDAAKMPAIGVIESKSSPTDCVVQALGEMKNVVSGVTPGRNVMVEVGGTVGHTFPSPLVGGTVRIQYIGVALSTDVVFVCPNFLLSVRTG
jgi:hypothetical protein